MEPNRRLKQARELRGWSQAKVAEEIGTDATTVSRWERGLFSPTPYFRERLCRLFVQNAEELGLLEAVDQPHGYERRSTPLSRPTPFPTNGDRRKEEVDSEHGGSLVPPSWSKRTNTFSYIMHSAMHDQQAHMLWGDAYVQALHGQHAEARRLGEASLVAFEGVGHLNALAVREWLNQHELTPAAPVTTMHPMPPSPLSKQRNDSSRRFPRRKTTGIVLSMLLVVVLAYICFSLNQAGTSALASSSHPHVTPDSRGKTPLNSSAGLVGIATATSIPSSTAHSTSAPSPTAPAASTPSPVVISSPVSSSNPGSTPVSSPTAVPTWAPSPTATPTPMPSPTPTSTPVSSSAFTALVLPQALSPQNCPQDYQSYRCTLNLSLSTASNQGSVYWSASSPNLDVKFNPAKGTETSGTTAQVIVYVQSLPGQKGQILIAFTFASSAYTATIVWQG